MSEPEARARLGTAVLALIEPHPAQARAFNAWYELDHFYAAAMAGPGAFAGGRWVATRACKDVRVGDGLFGDPGRGSYLAAYWVLDGMQPDWDAWTAGQVARLRAEGRMFAGRDHLHTAVYGLDWEERAPGGPPVEVALDRCFPGVVLLAVSRTGDARRLAREIVGEDVPLCVGFTQHRLVMSALGAEAVTDPDSHALLLAFCASDPEAIWRARVSPALAGGPPVRFGGPFRRTVPGTDAYVDEL